LALERTAFMRLMKTGATLAPIEHMLATAACCNRRAARATDAADRHLKQQASQRPLLSVWRKGRFRASQ
jgi:hypothetical protein